MNTMTPPTLIIRRWTHTLAWLPAVGLLAGGAPPATAQTADSLGASRPPSSEIHKTVLERHGDETQELFPPELRDSVSSAIAKAADVGRAVAFNFANTGTPRTLVLPDANLSPEQADQLNEDLAVMSRILDKAVRDPSGARTSGFTLDAWSRLGRRAADAFYLGGFGALFLVNVDFPLVAAPKTGDDEQPPSADTAWEEARRELQQGPGSTVPLLGDVFHSFRSAGPEFRPSAVADLREETIHALKHAANIRGLSDGDRVAVAVFGPAADSLSEQKVEVRSDNAARSRFEVIRTPRPNSGSFMTFQATKADIDAFAQGQLTEDDFAKRVTVTTR